MIDKVIYTIQLLILNKRYRKLQEWEILLTITFMIVGIVYSLIYK